MPILEEKWYQQSACWNSTGSWEVAYASVAWWSCKSPSHSRLSISIMHHWWDVEEKFWDCLATGSFSGSNGSPRITALVGSASNPPMTEARLCRSSTGFCNLVISDWGYNRYCIVQLAILWLATKCTWGGEVNISTGQIKWNIIRFKSQFLMSWFFHVPFGW